MAPSKLKKMRFDEFDPRELPPGFKQAVYMDVVNLATGPLSIPVLAARGVESGPTIAVLGGVHGDEYEGPYAVRQVFESLRPSEMTGIFLGVPHSNPPAFVAGTRVSPLDNGNLARLFPGDPHGTVTERIAHFVGQRIIGNSDLLIDLHSSGLSTAIPPMIGYYSHESDVGRASKAAAEIFGMPVIWGHPDLAPGRTITEATDRGIPWLYTESLGGGVLHLEHAAMYTRGVRNVMKHLGILQGVIEPCETTHRLFGDGNLSKGVRTDAGGYLVARVEILDKVQRGDILGTVFGLAGEVLDEIRAPHDGVVICMHAAPSVSAGDVVFSLTGEELG